MSPPAPERFVVQCECGKMLTLKRNDEIVCPSCKCVHRERDLLQRLEEEPPATHHEEEAGGG